MAKKKRSTKMWLLILASLLIVVLIIANVLKKDKGIMVNVSHPKRSTIVETIPANGKIQPVVEVKISPDVSGEIIELNYKEGDYIKSGDLIIKIKQDIYISLKERAEASLNSVKAQYIQQEAQLKQIEQNYLRNKALYEQKAISDAEYEDALSKYEVGKIQLKSAEYNIESANASLKEAEENLVKTTIYAPMDGIISKLSVERGERVVGTSQMAGTEMLRIANLAEMEVLVDVNENDIVRLSMGDTATIDVDAYPNRQFKGVVTQIANSAKNIGTSAEQVTNFEVKIFILPESYQDLLEQNPIPFRPGMSASVQIITVRKENVLSVPIQAVTTRGDLLPDSLKTNIGYDQFVFVMKEDGSNTVGILKVESGIQDMSVIEITEGLTDSVKIITGPYTAISKTLKEGSLVQIIEDAKGEK